ncbi:UNVERIFIED_CONTAM: hypothetical protein Sradi_3964900 [Sesamum radiatum]|uniref:SWIM-type domain-containing protein n=1 Tax=Sesamum radiatum TaxID=300843 RepID=A0AAW2PJ32_SESRA
MDSAADCVPVKSNDWNYEISCYDGSRFTVDLRAHTCSCRRWELCGIPCKHGMSAICAQMLDPEDFVHSCYLVQTYLKVYEPAMMPMNSKEMWEKDGKKGTRRKKETKMKRQSWKVHCKFCGAPGHNKKGCQWRKFAEEFPLDEEEQRSQPQVPDEMTQRDDVPVQEVDTQSQPAEQTVAATKPKLTFMNMLPSSKAKKSSKGGKRLLKDDFL